MRNVIIITLMLVVLAGCKSIEYIPVESVRSEVQYRDRLQRDSIHVLDSVFMLVRGDTVFRDRYRLIYRDKLIRDTAYIHKVDSIQAPYPIEKKLTRWQQMKLELGGWVFAALLIIIAVCILKKIIAI